MLGKLGDKLTTRRALVVVVGLLLALAWAVPSIGAGVGKVARLALGRANQAVYNSKLAIDTSGKAKTTANNANATAGAANTTANAARSTANAAQSTASQALSLATGSAHVAVNISKSVDAGNISGTSCANAFTFTQLGVLSTDDAIVTPPSTQPAGIVAQVTTSANQFSLVLCNVTGSPIDPPTGTYKFLIFR